MKFSDLDLKSIEKLFRTVIQEKGISEFLEKDSESIAVALIDHIIDLKKQRAKYPEIINRPDTWKENNTGQVNIASGNGNISASQNIVKE